VVRKKCADLDVKKMKAERGGRKDAKGADCAGVIIW
jgi:hypothetical protein